MKKIGHLAITASCFILLYTFSFFFVKPAHAVDLLDYFLPSNKQGNPVTTGEVFKPIDNGDGTFTVQKSKDANYYEKFKFDNSYIYHLEDTTWATETGDVMCTDSGNPAKLSYSGGSMPWAPREMDPGECFSNTGEVVGIDKSTGSQCSTSSSGTFRKREICLVHQGCIKFPNGTATADGVALEIKQGPGAGEQFFYDANRGWIGFNRGADGTGAYITQDISGSAGSLSGCLDVKVKPGFCTPGYTCPDTSNKTVFGETMNYSKIAFGGIASFSGPTGPELAKLRFPDYAQEQQLFMDPEIIARSMPFELTEKSFPKFEVPDLSGLIAHSGCERVTVDGADAGEARIKNDEFKRFPATPSYNQLLLGFRFWESQYVDGKGAKLKYKASDPQPGNPEVPEHRPNCNDKDGESYQEATTLSNPVPPKNSLVGVGGLVEKLVCSVAYVAGVGNLVCPTVSIKVQQEKYLPGEIAFMDESHNFLDTFIPFEEKGQPIDQEEANEYDIFNDPRVEGVNYLGAKTTQEKSLQLVKSLRPYEEARGITSLGSAVNPLVAKLPEAGLYYTIAYNDPNAVILTPEIKNKIIRMVKTSWSNTKIEQYWDSVVNAAIASDINPAFALTVWIEESGASHYSNHFSCPPSEKDFDKSFNCFIKTTNFIQPPNFAGWVRNYCGTPVDKPICSNDNNNNFIRNLKSWYDLIVPPGSPGAAQPM